MLAAAAIVLDAYGRPFASLAPGVHWLDLAAAASLAFGVRWRRLWRGEEAGTPLDGLVLGALAIGTIDVAGTGGQADAVTWLAHALACSGLYFGLTQALRRDPTAIETVWRVMAGAALALGLHAVWLATQGAEGIVRGAAAVDLRWGGTQTLPKTLGFLAFVVAGRALDRNAGPLWRLAVVLGVIGAIVHGSDGFALGSRALARIDDPIFFSTLCVTLLLIAGVIREAWTLARVRAHEALRWRSLAIAMIALGLVGLLTEARSGEAVRALASMLGAGIMAARSQAAAAEAGGGAFDVEDEAPMAKAA